MKIIYKKVKPMNARSRLLSQNKKKQIMNINMKTVKSKLLHRALVLVNAYKCANFNFLAPLVTEIWRGPKTLGLLISSDLT